jgi:hypothetical protein
MTTKTCHRKAKAPTSSIISKIAPATTTSRNRSTTVASSTKASKSPSKNLKAALPSATAAPQVPANPVRDSKQARLIAKLRAKPGATIDQMMTLTGWQAHTVRGTISGVLRKKLGLTVDCQPSSDSGEHLYRIVNSPVRK